MSLHNEQASDKSTKIEATNHDVSPLQQQQQQQHQQEQQQLNPSSPEKTINMVDHQQPTLVSLPSQQYQQQQLNGIGNMNGNTLNSPLEKHEIINEEKPITTSTIQLNIPSKTDGDDGVGNIGVAYSPPITTNEHPLQPQQPTVANSTQPPQEGGGVAASVDQKPENEGKKKKKKRKEDYDDDDTENDLLDNDLEFSPEELEMLTSQDPPPLTFDLLSEIPQIPPHLRTRLTILQQQQIIYSLHSLNLNDKQRKELMLLGNVMKRITQDELMKCSIFESVNVYLFILSVSTLAAAVGTLALALIYFVVLKEAVAEGTFSIVLSAIFTITLVGCILLCIVFNIKNRPKHKFRKATLAHYHEIFEEAIYDIGVKFFPNFEIEFDYHNIIDNEEIEEMESKRRKIRQNYRYFEYFRSKRLLSKYTTEQLLCYLHITSAENDGIKKLFKIHTKDENENVTMENQEHRVTTGTAQEVPLQQGAQQDLNQNIVQIKKIPSYFSSFSTSNNSGIYVPAALIEQTSTPGDNVWYSLCCAFGGLCTLIIVLIFLLFSAICLFFPLIYNRVPKIPIFNTFPIEVGYGMVGVLGLTFLVLLCFSSCSVYCCLFVKHTNRSLDGEDDGEEQKPMCCCYFELDNNDDDGFLAPVGDLI